MAKPISTFTCAECGAIHKKWSGRCDAYSMSEIEVSRVDTTRGLDPLTGCVLASLVISALTRPRATG